jgi:uncharacterized membrane protein YdjX (TVP38/TMEM64 family)
VTQPVLDPASRSRSRASAGAKRLALGVLLAIAAWVTWSYQTGGLIHVLVATPPPGQSTLDAVRVYVLSYGLWAPVVYVAAVCVEVLVAPIPGTLLYAPAGAIFGGFMGGTLSLLGNVAGASIAAWLAATGGKAWLERHTESEQLTRIKARLQDRGVWVIFLLRLNPLTSSDLVSYAAGVAGVPVRHVAAGTFLGMIPHCYLQAYLAQTLFDALPSGPWVPIGAVLFVLLAAVVMWRIFAGSNPGEPPPLASCRAWWRGGRGVWRYEKIRSQTEEPACVRSIASSINGTAPTAAMPGMARRCATRCSA